MFIRSLRRLQDSFFLSKTMSGGSIAILTEKGFVGHSVSMLLLAPLDPLEEEGSFISLIPQPEVARLGFAIGLLMFVISSVVSQRPGRCGEHDAGTTL